MKRHWVYIIFLFFLLTNGVLICAQNTSSTSFEAVIADLQKKGREYEIAARTGNKDAALECGLTYLKMGQLYWNHCIYYDNSVLKDEYYGRGMIAINANKKRRDFALPYIYKAAHYGIADAQFIAGNFLFSNARDMYIGQYRCGTKEYNSVIAQTEKDGINYLKLAYLQNHLNAANRLGQIGFEHPNQYISKTEAYNCDLLVTKLSNKYPDAFYRIGCYLESGIDSISVNMDSAVEYYKVAADLGNYNAAKRLAQIYRTGKGGIPKNNKLHHQYNDIAKQNDSPVSNIERFFVTLFSLLLLFFIYFVGIKCSKFYKPKIERLFQYIHNEEPLSNRHIKLIQIITFILSIATLIGGVVLFYKFSIHYAGTAFDNNVLPELLHFLNPFRGL